MLARDKVRGYYRETEGAFSNLYGHVILLTPYLKKKI